MKKSPIVKRRKRKFVLFILELVILAILAAGLFLYEKLGQYQNVELDASQVEVNDDISEATKATFEGNMTIAMFGLDNRQMGEYDTGNSDLIMVLNIDNDTGEVSMVSVYRDTFLNVASSDSSPSFKKANYAYAAGGPERAISMLNKNLDLDIDNYVSFDFEAVAEAIDILGGVDVDIADEEELGYLNDYILYTNDILETDAEQVTGVGTHTLNGVQAVAYARIRYTAGGDYKRAERQRRVFSTMIQKAKKASPSQLMELVDTVFPYIQSDLTEQEMISMVTSMIGYDISSSSGFPFDRAATDLGDKGSVVVPCDLQTNVTKLHENMFGETDYTPSQTVQEYSSLIVNETGMTTSSAETDQFSEGDDTGTTDTTTETQDTTQTQ